LILVSKYGAKKRSAEFSAEKYFAAFLKLTEDLIEREHSPIDRMSTNCYSIRTFERFLYFFGLVNIDKASMWNQYEEVKKTDLFDRLIYCSPIADFFNN
jgi:hypothetical protein